MLCVRPARKQPPPSPAGARVQVDEALPRRTLIHLKHAGGPLWFNHCFAIGPTLAFEWNIGPAADDSSIPSCSVTPFLPFCLGSLRLMNPASNCFFRPTVDEQTPDPVCGWFIPIQTWFCWLPCKERLGPVQHRAEPAGNSWLPRLLWAQWLWCL